MVAKRIGQLAGATDTSVSLVQPSEMEISQIKFLDRKTKMVVKRSGRLVVTANTSVLSGQRSEMEISIKNLGRKRKCSLTDYGSLLVPMIHLFRLCNLQKWRYRKKNILGRKTKKDANLSGQLLGAADITVLPVLP